MTPNSYLQALRNITCETLDNVAVGVTFVVVIMKHVQAAPLLERSEALFSREINMHVKYGGLMSTNIYRLLMM